MANGSTAKRKPWIDPSAISAASAVAARPKPGRHPDYESEIDDAESPRRFERSIARKFTRQKEKGEC